MYTANRKLKHENTSGGSSGKKALSLDCIVHHTDFYMHAYYGMGDKARVDRSAIVAPGAGTRGRRCLPDRAHDERVLLSGGPDVAEERLFLRRATPGPGHCPPPNPFPFPLCDATLVNIFVLIFVSAEARLMVFKQGMGGLGDTLTHIH